MRIYVAIATVGRADLLVKTVDRLSDQTRKPDGVVISVPSSKDVAGIEKARTDVHILLSPKGLAAQRNVALDHLRDKADVVIFFDDDFVPANDFLAEVERVLTQHAEIAGLTGYLVDDGIHGDPIAFDDAVHRLDVLQERRTGETKPRESLYGCNMVLRMSAAEGLTFDENLPLYAWLEDVDMTYQLGRRGKLIACPYTTGIHLGTRGGRTSGTRLGYSQIANVIYLSRKKTIPFGLGPRLVCQNLLANIGRSFWPEAGIDRRGRLKGNFLAIADLLSGKLDPRKILLL